MFHQEFKINIRLGIIGNHMVTRHLPPLNHKGHSHPNFPQNGFHYLSDYSPVVFEIEYEFYAGRHISTLFHVNKKFDFHNSSFTYTRI